MNYLKENAENHKKVLGKYSLQTINSGIIISATMVLITYTIYAMNSVTNDWRMIITVPLVVYMIFRQLYLLENGKSKNLSDEILRDRPSIITVLVYAFSIIILLYFVPSDLFMT